MAGAGPAGSTTSRMLAGEGMSVLLAEKCGPPRDKVCGGLLSKVCLDLVNRHFGRSPPREARLEPEELGVFVVPPSGVIGGLRVPGESLLNIRRREFDSWLAESAERGGAELLRDSEIVDFRECGDEVEVLLDTPDGPTTATTRYLVGADGVYSRTAEKMFHRTIDQKVVYAQEYFPRLGNLEDCFFMFYRGDVSPTYSYVIPKGDQLCLGIGILSNKPPKLKEGLSRLKNWLGRDFGVSLADPIRQEGFSAPFGGIRFGKGRVFLVGDAAGFCNPLTGEGIAYAMGSGEAAAKAIILGDPHPHEVYAAAMGKVAGELQDLVRQTLAMNDDEREKRVAARKRLSLSNSTLAPYPKENP